MLIKLTSLKLRNKLCREKSVQWVKPGCQS